MPATASSFTNLFVALARESRLDARYQIVDAADLGFRRWMGC